MMASGVGWEARNKACGSVYRQSVMKMHASVGYETCWIELRSGSLSGSKSGGGEEKGRITRVGNSSWEIARVRVRIRVRWAFLNVQHRD